MFVKTSGLVSLFSACSCLTGPQRTGCQRSLSLIARTVWSWAPTDSVVSIFRVLGCFLPMIRYFFSPMPMCFRMFGKSVCYKAEMRISSKYPCSEPNLKTVVKQLSFAFSSLFTKLPGALLLSQRLM